MSHIVDTLRTRVDSAWDIVNHYYREDLGQEACKKALANIGLNRDDYIYVEQVDSDGGEGPIIIVHPDKGFVGRPTGQVVDLDRVQEIYYHGQVYPLGHPTIAGIRPTHIATEIKKVCAQGSGVIHYYWARVVDGKPSQVGYPKVSYLRYFPEWKWAIGCGAYADHIDALVADQMEIARANIHQIWRVFFSSTAVICVVLSMISIGISHKYSARLIQYEKSLLDSQDRLRREAEKSQRAERIFETLITNLPQKVVLKDLNSKVIYCNEKYAESLNRTIEQVIGKSDSDLYPRIVANKYKASDWTVIVENKTMEGFLRRRIHGQDTVTRVLKTPVRTKGDHVEGILCIFEDFTERYQNEERLQAANARLEEANRQLREAQAFLIQSEKMASIGQLAAGIAHEINNPMAYVVGNSHTLRDYVANLTEMLKAYDQHFKELAATGAPQCQEHASRIQEARDSLDIDHICVDIQGLLDDSQEGMDRVLHIVRNLRSFSRIDQAEHMAMSSLNEGIQSTLGIAHNELAHRAQVTTELGDIPDIPCNAGEINQVILNILVNAAQAIAEQDREDMGHIVIRTFQDGDHVVCTIADDGPGIPQENLTKIFDPFFTTKPVGQGTGLGLHISYDIIVRQHGGRLSVESELGKGATFTFALPIHGKPSTDAEQGQEHEREDCAVC